MYRQSPVLEGTLAPEDLNTQKSTDDTDPRKVSLKPNKQTIADERKQRQDDRAKQPKERKEKKRDRTSDPKKDSKYFSQKLPEKRRESLTPKRGDRAQHTTNAGDNKENPGRKMRNTRERGRPDKRANIDQREKERKKKRDDQSDKPSPRSRSSESKDSDQLSVSLSPSSSRADSATRIRLDRLSRDLREAVSGRERFGGFRKKDFYAAAIIFSRAGYSKILTLRQMQENARTLFVQNLRKLTGK